MILCPATRDTLLYTNAQDWTGLHWHQQTHVPRTAELTYAKQGLASAGAALHGQ